MKLVARVEGSRTETRMPATRIPAGDFISWSLEHDLSQSIVATYAL